MTPDVTWSPASKIVFGGHVEFGSRADAFAESRPVETCGLASFTAGFLGLGAFTRARPPNHDDPHATYPD